MIDEYCRTGLIEPEQLMPCLNDPNQEKQIRLIDASFALPNAPNDPAQTFQQMRIDDAAFFSIDEIADHTTDLPHMLPDAQTFSDGVSSLGISNDDFIVVYDQTGIGMAACRIWWMFHVFGHDRVVVLNGGLPAWRTAGYPLNTNPPAAIQQAGQFKARIVHTEMVADRNIVLAALDHLPAPHIIDMRPAARFSGQAPEPRTGLRTGHIPGSRNLPWSTLVDPGTGKLKPADTLESTIKSAGITPGEPVICSCGSGVSACVLAFALYHLGYGHNPVYDGSWAEWGQESCPTPVECSFAQNS